MLNQAKNVDTDSVEAVSEAAFAFSIGSTCHSSTSASTRRFKGDTKALVLSV